MPHTILFRFDGRYLQSLTFFINIGVPLKNLVGPTLVRPKTCCAPGPHSLKGPAPPLLVRFGPWCLLWNFLIEAVLYLIIVRCRKLLGGRPAHFVSKFGMGHLCTLREPTSYLVRVCGPVRKMYLAKYTAWMNSYTGRWDRRPSWGRTLHLTFTGVFASCNA